MIDKNVHLIVGSHIWTMAMLLHYLENTSGYCREYRYSGNLIIVIMILFDVLCTGLQDML